MNRSLLVLVAAILALLAVATWRTLGEGAVRPPAPLYAPADSAPAAPAVNASAKPFPATESAIPAQNGVISSPVTVTPAATAVPRPSVPVRPAASAAPGGDIHSVAPEDGIPGFNPPPGRE